MNSLNETYDFLFRKNKIHNENFSSPIPFYKTVNANDIEEELIGLKGGLIDIYSFLSNKEAKSKYLIPYSIYSLLPKEEQELCLFFTIQNKVPKNRDNIIIIIDYYENLTSVKQIQSQISKYDFNKYKEKYVYINLIPDLSDENKIINDNALFFQDIINNILSDFTFLNYDEVLKLNTFKNFDSLIIKDRLITGISSFELYSTIRGAKLLNAPRISSNPEQSHILSPEVEMLIYDSDHSNKDETQDYQVINDLINKMERVYYFRHEIYKIFEYYFKLI